MKLLRKILSAEFIIIRSVGVVQALKLNAHFLKLFITSRHVFTDIVKKGDYHNVLVGALRAEDVTQIKRNSELLLERINFINENFKSTRDKVVRHCIDNAQVVNGDLIKVKGWAFSRNGIKRIIVKFDQQHEYELTPNEIRNDVVNAFPNNKVDPLCGFDFRFNFKVSEYKVEIQFIDRLNFIDSKIVNLKTVSDWSSIDNEESYSIYIKQNELSDAQILQKKRECSLLSYQPKISIIVPVYNVSPKWLDLCIKSVINQYYSNWELCLYDDLSTQIETLECLRRWNKREDLLDKVKIKFGTKNKNISLASNEAIKMSTGEFISLLDNDDELAPDALFEVVKALNTNRELDLIYSDEDKLEMNGERTGVYFKSDFSLDLLLTNNYICHFTTIRKSIGDSFGWFEKGLEGSQDHDVILKTVESTSVERIHHIPKVLYHWRKIPGSTAESYDSKGYAFTAGQKAIQGFLDRQSCNAKVEQTKRGGVYRVYWPVDDSREVSIIIPFKDHVALLKKCIESILSKTIYKNYKIVLINNKSEKQETLNYLKKIRSNEKVSVFSFDQPFNYSKMNNWAVDQVQSEYVLFLNNDIEVISRGWLQEMAQHIQRDDVGAVGAQLLYNDDTIQHYGCIVGVNGVAGHVWQHEECNNIPHFSFGTTRNVSAVTAACLLTKKSVFQDVKGFDDKNLKIAFNDIDYCLKLRGKGELIVFTPHAKLYHYESKTRGLENTLDKKQRFNKEIMVMYNKWGLTDFLDPYYNPNLSKYSLQYQPKIAMLKGHVDGFNDNLLLGWAISLINTTSVMIEIVDDITGNVVATGMAQQYRSGLQKKKIHPTGNAGFEIRINRDLISADNDIQMLRVYGKTEETHRVELTGSPIFLKPLKNAIPKVYFMHIAKTGGTSINNYFKNIYPDQKFREHVEGNRDWSEEGVKRLYTFDFISGHMGLLQILKFLNLDEYYKMTVFRNPIDHLISHLNWVTSISELPHSSFFLNHSKEVQNLSLSLRNLDKTNIHEIEDYFINLAGEGKFLFDNCQTRYLLPNPRKVSLEENDYNIGLKTIENFNLIGTLENLKYVFDELNKKFDGMDLSKEIPMDNENSYKYFNKATLEKLDCIQQLIWFDQQLYNYINKKNKV